MPRRAAMFLIRIYQKLVSPFLGKNCRYQPTCSRYTYEAVERFGVMQGVALVPSGWRDAIRSARAVMTPYLKET